MHHVLASTMLYVPAASNLLAALYVCRQIEYAYTYLLRTSICDYDHWDVAAFKEPG